MKRLKRWGIYAVVGMLACAVMTHISNPDSVMACLAIALAVVTADGLLRMCDRLLDPPPVIFQLFCGNPRIISENPPHDLTDPASQSDH
ncbi:MAG: hypothetical protein ACYC64_19000 [Armatimonadota bacterium]